MTRNSFGHAGRRLLFAATLLLAGGFTLTAGLACGQSSEGLLEQQQGEASYYGEQFAGNTTASGDVFDPESLTAAHQSLPFGSRVRVHRVGTSASVVVRINDRGPYAGDRIIDLSRAAAEEIGMVEDGIMEVRVEVLEIPPGS